MSGTFFEAEYQRNRATFGEAPDALLLACARGLEAGAALDAGGGQGRNGLALAALGWRVTLLDAAAAAVDTTTALARERKLEVTSRVMDLREFSSEPEFDLVACAITLHAFKSQRAQAVAHALRRAVRSNGAWYLSVHLSGSHEEERRIAQAQEQVEPRTFVEDGRHKRLFSLDEARELLSWAPAREEIARAERCPRATCPYLHDVYRGYALRPAQE